MINFTKKSGVNTNGIVPHLVFDPKLYITIALFAGEAGPSILKSSGWMYIFGAIGLLLLITKRKFVIRKNISVVLIIYAVVILRNISFNDTILYYYELPNIGTAFLLLLLNCVFYSDKDIKCIEKYIFFYALILSILGIYKFIINPTERLAVFGGPNGYYKIVLLFEVLCFYHYLLDKEKKYLVGVVLGLMLCMATGSKGGIVSMVIILLLEIAFFIFNSGEKRTFFIKRLLQLLLIIVAGYYLIRYAINTIPGLSVMMSRANVFLYSRNLNSLASVSSRIDLIKLGLEFFKESPIIGKGASYTYFYTNGTQPYPHNIFVEFLSENGLIATIPLLVFFLDIIIKTVRFGICDSHLFCLFLCLGVYFSGSLFSGNILDSKPIFVFGILFFNYDINSRFFVQEANGE